MRARSLRTRLLWGTLLIIAVVMTAVMVVVEHHQRTAIVDEVQRRGEVLARGLATTAQTPLLLYNFTALEQNVAQAAAEDDVPYAIVLDADGRVAAHSERPERVGLLLHGALDRKAAETTSPLVQETTTETGEGIYDFAVPIVVGQQKWGTARIGVSKLRMDQLIRRTRWELGGLTAAMLVVGGLAGGVVPHSTGSAGGVGTAALEAYAFHDVNMVGPKMVAAPAAPPILSISLRLTPELSFLVFLRFFDI